MQISDIDDLLLGGQWYCMADNKRDAKAQTVAGDLGNFKSEDGFETYTEVGTTGAQSIPDGFFFHSGKRH